MNTKMLVSTLCIGLSVSSVVVASESPWYVGIKGGTMDVDPTAFKDATSLGLLLGYKFSQNSSGSLAIEGEYNNSSRENVTVLNVTGKWDMETLAVYLAYRTAGDLYFKGKLGYLNEDVKVSIAGTGISGSDSGLSVGVGGGWKFGKNNSLELEYTLIEEDVNFISLGVNFGF